MRRKGRKILLNRLIVADVGQHRVENGELGTVGRNRHARLRHKGEKADGFQRYRFAAGVRTSDDELTSIVLKLDCDGDDGAAFTFKVALEQRMARVVQEQACGVPLSASGFRNWATFGRRRSEAAVPTCAEEGFYAVVVFGEAGLGELQFEFREGFQRGLNFAGLRTDMLCHFEQDAMDLRQLFFEQPHEFIVLLDCLEGLDEDGLAAGARAVNDALHAPFLLDLDWNDETLAADGDQFILYCAAFREPT